MTGLREELAPTGGLRAVVNLGNPVLAQGTAEDPSGVTVEIARALALRLGVPLHLTCVDAARDAVAALLSGAVDVGFVAVEPARERELAFTAPYALIEGVFAVPLASPVTAVADVDRPGVRIGVKRGSAYDLFLTRTCRSAEVVRGEEGTAVFREQGLEVAAGIRQPMAQYVSASPDLRLVGEAFMQIRQAVAVPAARSAEAVAFLRGAVEELKASGLVAAALRRSGQGDVAVAPPL